MTLLHWKKEYSVGIASVDHEHQELIQMINDLSEQIEGVLDAEQIDSFLGELHAAVSAHFALEERAMEKAGYDEYAGHKADHEALLDQIRSMMDAFLADPRQGRLMLQERLGSWFAGHFSTFDARLHGALDH